MKLSKNHFLTLKPHQQTEMYWKQKIQLFKQLAWVSLTWSRNRIFSNSIMKNQNTLTDSCLRRINTLNMWLKNLKNSKNTFLGPDAEFFSKFRAILQLTKNHFSEEKIWL